MTSQDRRTPPQTTPAERRAVELGVPLVVAHAARLGGALHGVPMSRMIAVAEAESSFLNVWGHDAGKWREAGPLTAASVARYWAQPSARRPNGAGVWQLTFEPFQRAAGRAGGLWSIGAQAMTAGSVIRGLPDAGATAVGISRYNGAGPAARAYGQRVHAREAHWHRALTGTL